MFKIKTYSDLSDEEKEGQPLKRDVKTIMAVGADGIHSPEHDKTRERVLCGCGRRVWPWVLVDCRHLPIEEDWACDGCWTDWQRTRKCVDGGNPIIPDPDSHDFTKRDENIRTRREWDRRWLKAHGASPEDLNTFDNANHNARG